MFFYFSKWLIFHSLSAVIICYVTFQVIFGKNGKIPTIIWWTPLLTTDNRSIQCGGNLFETQECLVTVDRLSPYEAVLFHGSSLSNYDFPLPRSQSVLWALYHGESPKNMPHLLYMEVQQLFNVTATFSRYSDFPLTLQYLKTLNMLTDKTYYISVKKKNVLLKNLAPLLYIQSNCDTVSPRDSLVMELMKFTKIDSYGNCLNNKQWPLNLETLNPLDIYNNELMRLIGQYKFTISIENALCEDYISEKLWRPLIVGSIPIYLGSPNVKDWLPNNNALISIDEFKDMKSLASFINEINGNDTLYNSYLQHKLTGLINNEQLKKNYYMQRRENEHAIMDFECFICRKLHGGLSKKNNENIFKCVEPRPDSSWFEYWINAKYQAKALDSRIRTNKTFTQEDFEASLLNFMEEIQ